MSEEERKAYEAGIRAIRGAKDECETIAVYLTDLIAIGSDSQQAYETALPQYMNIIRDELNHALRFIFNVFTPVTGLEPDTDGIEEE